MTKPAECSPRADLSELSAGLRALVGGETELVRDRLAENTARKIFRESLQRHLATPASPLRAALDPLKLFPLEFSFHNDVYK